MIENFGQEIKKIYVINEKKFVERRKKFQSQFKKSLEEGGVIMV